MSAQTGIEWCDSTFNPWMGCTKVSPACDHCYAERDTKRFGRVEWGAGKPRVRTGEDNWRNPKRWNDAPFLECDCGYRGTLHQMTTNAVHGCGLRFRPARRRVFCASLADWLDNEAPIEWLIDLLDLIRRTPNLDWLLLTKRIGRFWQRLNRVHDSERVEGELAAWVYDWLGGMPPRNVLIGSTVINQAEVDRDVPKLLTVPARRRFLSIEPMLGPINLEVPKPGPDLYQGGGAYICQPWLIQSGIDWVIAGGESGPHARPMHPDWVRSLRDQCTAAGVPFLFKQWGEWLPDSEWRKHSWLDARVPPNRNWMLLYGDGQIDIPDDRAPNGINGEIGTCPVGKRAAGRKLDGIEHNGFPEVRS